LSVPTIEFRACGTWIDTDRLRIYACGGPERRMIVVSVSATP
jgi:hypothetical protein